MGLYEKNTYLKDKNGRWHLVGKKIEQAPHDYGRWAQSCALEKRSGLGEKTYINHVPTRTGINRKVTEARTYFGKNEKVVRKLITTSSKLPQGYRRKNG